MYGDRWGRCWLINRHMNPKHRARWTADPMGTTGSPIMETTSMTVNLLVLISPTCSWSPAPPGFSMQIPGGRDYSQCQTAQG